MDTESIEQTLEPWLSVKVVIVQPITTLSVMFLVYGIYVIIFGLSIHVLWRRRESPASMAHMRWAISLFVLANIYVSVTTWTNVYQTLISFNAAKTRDYTPLINSLSGGNSTAQAAQLALSSMTCWIMGCIADYLLVYRCYVVWGHNKMVLFPTAFAAIVADTMGFAISVVLIKAYCTSDGDLYRKVFAIDQVLVIVTAVYTSLLTLLTAGRIWSISRDARREAAETSVGGLNYNVIVATILESGILYAIALLVAAIAPIFTDPNDQGLSPFDFDVIAQLMTAIAPTMMIVRIAYGKSVESVEQVMTSLRFAEAAANGSQQRSAGAPQATTADLRESFFDTSEERAPAGNGREREKPYVTIGENMA
ncbi:hypothetical protein V5O48_008253 [Marasmius crinis-equi]|uniref:Uncharacterized protein n=1 Tax=Marasmius crinis-equi TaxID=585013 RepID=A0ABR3FEI3_9AGAR